MLIQGFFCLFEKLPEIILYVLYTVNISLTLFQYVDMVLLIYSWNVCADQQDNL